MPDAGLAHAGEASLAASVVIPVHNGAAVIVDCVRSLLAQAFPRADFEVIVVENGSTDDTVDRLRFLDNDIRLLHEPMRGAAAARNCGVRAARGRVVAFTDADCVADPGWLGALVAAVDDTTVGVAGGPVLSRRPCNRIAAFGEQIHDQHAAITTWKPPYVASGNWGSRREVLIEAGLFDVTLRRGQDADLSQRIHRAGFALVYVPDARVYHMNEHTLAGLVREGYQHGQAGVGVRSKSIAAGLPARRTTVWSRTKADLRRLSGAPATLESWLWLLFNVGKSVGELAAVLRSRGTRSTGPVPPRPA